MNVTPEILSLALLLFPAASVSRDSSADDNTVETRFRAEIVQAHDRLRERLKKFSMNGHENRITPKDVAARRFAIQGQRLGENQMCSITALPKAGVKSEGNEAVYGINSQKFFDLKRDGSSDRFVILSLERTTKENLANAKFELQMQIQLFDLISSSNRLGQKSLTSFLRDPGFHLISAGELAVDGKTLVEVKFSCDGERYDPLNDGAGLNQVLSATVLFDPDLDWAISKYNLAYKHSAEGAIAELSGFTRYDETRAGRAIPKRIFQKISVKLSDSTLLEQRDLVIDHFEEDGLSASHFELPAFGLPDIPLEPVRTTDWFSLRGWFFWTMVSISVGAFVAQRFLLRRR